MKICITCNVPKPLSDFFNQKRNKDGKFAECKICCDKRNKKWQLANPEKYKAVMKHQREKHKTRYLAKQRQTYHATDPVTRYKKKTYYRLRGYGLTQIQYDSIFLGQNGLCAICNKPPDGERWKKLCIDHDHSTGQVRGLLCSTCNTALGKFQDSQELLQKAIDYLKQCAVKQHGKKY